MRCEILASVMNQKNQDEIIKRLGVSNNDKCLIINQVTENIRVEKDVKSGNHRFLSFKEKGVSKSRNCAIENARGDICCVCDNDCTYVDNYQTIVGDAYNKYKDADIIAFDYVRADKTRKTMRGGRVRYPRSMKISEIQITFRRKSIEKTGIRFDEEFGPGVGPGAGKNNWGEGNIFLFDCLRAGLKIYYVPTVLIIIKEDLGTTWDKSNTPEHYIQQGVIYRRMSPLFWWILVFQFALRKRKIYGKDMNFYSVLKYMTRGARSKKIKEVK